MVVHYFKAAWRHLIRNSQTGIINISGLSLGIACALLISVYIKYELTFDRFHPYASRIYQIVLNTTSEGQDSWAGNTPPPVGAALANNIPEIESFTRIYKSQDVVIRTATSDEQLFFTEKNVLAVDSNFLQLFGFQLRDRLHSAPIIKQGSIFLTEAMAQKYFGTYQVVGKTLVVGPTKKPFLIAGVLKNLPSQSSLQFDFLTSTADYPAVKYFDWSWVWRQMICYVKLTAETASDPATLKRIESKFPDVLRTQAASGFSRLGTSYDDYVKKAGKWEFHLHPLTRVHLYSSHMTMPWISKVSSIQYVYIFGSIALLIIVLACINFMNLATARAVRRCKEVCVRKIAGSSRVQLMLQFLSEAFLYTIVAIILGIGLAYLVFEPFSQLAAIPGSVGSVFSPVIWLLLLALLILVTFLAGIYPAFFLTSFNPVNTVKRNHLFKEGKKNLTLRNGLVILQFMMSTFMIIGTLVIYNQLRYFRSADVGFSRQNILMISNTHRLEGSEESYRQSISELKGVVGASVSTSVPSGFLFGDGYQPKPSPNEQVVSELDLTSYMVDYDFIPTLGIEIKKGRNFSRSFNDSASILLNEEAVRQIGWKNPVGQWIQYPGGNDVMFQVIGVIKNFNVESMHTPIVPFALFHISSKTYDLGVSHMLVKIEPKDMDATLARLERKWKEFSTNEPFDYQFLDAVFDSQYRSEQKLGSIFILFTSLAIFIACMGLFGLCAYMAERRTKEIGIRKVLGATVHNVVGLLSKEFLKLTAVAVLISFPIAWWAMNTWLEDFAFRINIGWEIFVTAALITFAISMGTIIFQALKAAVANPARSLRIE
jgi:putative ABC transport system permease protein